MNLGRSRHNFEEIWISVQTAKTSCAWNTFNAMQCYATNEVVILYKMVEQIQATQKWTNLSNELKFETFHNNFNLLCF